jgi:hypothetical protein
MDDPRDRFLIPRQVLLESRHFLAEPGREGLEAVVLWLGQRSDERDVQITAVHMPRQYAIRSSYGVAVSVCEDALTELISTLSGGVFVPVRLHTHPGAAYHSSTDDENMLISHRGAISIVVPDFARREIDLTHCSVNELDAGHRWRELSDEEVQRRFMVSG